MSLLKVKDLSVGFSTMRGPLKAVDRISFEVAPGETLGIVGESGCGKSITSLALMGLLAPNARLDAAQMSFAGRELTSLPESERRKLRGGDMAMIFQDPMSSLNPSFTVGFQLMETLKEHGQANGKAELQRRAIELLSQVGIPAPETRLSAFPHQLSGGMCQRVMIAMAIACRPKLLIADEPTTALDVTIQAQILELLKKLQRETQMALILITHDIGVVSQVADRILVMYAGQIVETGRTPDVMRDPRHPYTKGLLSCLPLMHGEEDHRKPLPSIRGMVPDLVHRPKGCQLNPRCDFAQDRCRSEDPPSMELGRVKVRCFYPLSTGAPTEARP